MKWDKIMLRGSDFRDYRYNSLLYAVLTQLHKSHSIGAQQYYHDLKEVLMTGKYKLKRGSYETMPTIKLVVESDWDFHKTWHYHRLVDVDMLYILPNYDLVVSNPYNICEGKSAMIVIHANKLYVLDGNWACREVFFKLVACSKNHTPLFSMDDYLAVIEKKYGCVPVEDFHDNQSKVSPNHGK